MAVPDTPRIRDLRVSTFTIPTDAPEADGTFRWDRTTLVLVEVTAGDATGLGFTYGAKATGALIAELLRDEVVGQSAFDVPRLWQAMRHRLRNAGRPGIGSMAVAAVDLALWDLKARLLNLPLVQLLGARRSAVPVYGSGGFTSYSDDQLRSQLGGWVEAGIPRVKMKIGTSPADDPRRVSVAREAIGAHTELFVDANGAFDSKQALAMAELIAAEGVSWFEEPVSSDDLDGLHLLRERVPAGMEVAAGEYGYDLVYFKRMLERGAVDVLQADVTRCEGLTGFLKTAALCEAFELPLSGHTSPSMHLHVCAAAPALRHLEYFHDHVRIERMLFDGVVTPVKGALHPDLSRPGHGIEFRRRDAERFAS
jgi:L-alanine-DL-glutamate epimerase-like enolase superfamily enzyme